MPPPTPTAALSSSARHVPRAAADVPAVARALAVMDLLARERRPLHMAGIAATLALPKSSVHGLCNTLLSHGYLRRADNGAFQIGPGVMNLAEAFVADTHVAGEFDALWREAGAPPDETLILSVLSGAEVVYVGVRNSARPLGLAFTVGMRLPAWLSGSGKAMLSRLPVDAVRRLYAEGLVPRLTKKGPRDLDALLRELAATRKRGYSVDEEAVREGVVSFGAPVVDASGSVVAGVAVCVNKAVLAPGRHDRYRQQALAVASALSARLGASPRALATPGPGPAFEAGGAGMRQARSQGAR